MPKGRVANTSGTPKKRRPALSPEARQNQLISLAIDLVEQRLIDGTASSQETTHFLKLATRKSMLENEKLEKENSLITAKTEAIHAEKERENLFKDAIAAMKRYSGHGGDTDESDEY